MEVEDERSHPQSSKPLLALLLRCYSQSMRRFPFIRVGLIFAISPLLLAFVTSIFQGGSMWDEGIAAVPGDPVPALFLLLPLVPLCRHGTSAARSPLTPRQIQIMLMH